MELCSDHHDEICYHNGRCPLCESRKEIDQLKEELRSANLYADTLVEERNDLQRQLDQEPVIRAIERVTQ